MSFIQGQIPRDRFVSAEGSDGNPGTAQFPWATIARVNAEELAPNTRVYFRGGDTFFGQLNNGSSGAPGQPIVYRSYGTGRATLSGGARVSTWNLIDAGKKIWRASMLASDGRPRAVWIDGRRASMAVTTSLGTMTPTATGWNSTLLAGAAFPDQVELRMTFSLWSQKYVQVQSATGTTITISPNVKAIMDAAALFLTVGGSDVPYEARNIYESFVADANPDTFFQDRTNNFLYIIPPTDVADPNTVEVIAGVAEKVIHLSNVSDVVIGNLAIKHTTNLRPYHPDAYISNQSGACIDANFSTPNGQSNGQQTTYDGAVTLENCTRVKLDRTLVMDTGNHGVKISGGSSDCEVEGSIIVNVGGSSIDIGQPGYLHSNTQTSPVTPQVPQPSGIYVHDCVLRRAGVDFIDAPIMLAWYLDNSTISYNRIHDGNYSCISIGWGFGQYQAAFQGGNLVERNEVYDGMKKLSDGAGIYANGVNETTTTIRLNWVHDIDGSYAGANNIKQGVYLDGGSYRHVVQNNVFNSIEVDVFGLNSNDNGSSKDMPRAVPNNVMNNNTADENTTRFDNANNTTSPNTIVSTAAAQAAGAALGCGPRAEYEDVIAEAEALA